MDRKIKYKILSITFTVLLGILLHFTYKLSGNNSFIALFSSTNESVWEHLKLVYFPMLITTIIGNCYIGKNTSNFLCSKVIGIIVAMFFIVIFFYTYSGILGRNIAIIDIASFIVAVLLGEYISYKLITSKFVCNNKIAILALLFISLLFITFTFFPPNFGIFRNPKL